MIHGHSAHHAKGIEVYAGKPILYGCGDFLKDYEGIEGYEGFRGELTLMYFLTLDVSQGRLARLDMTPSRFTLPTESRRRRGRHVAAGQLDRECAKLGTRVESTADDRLRLVWPDGSQ